MAPPRAPQHRFLTGELVSGNGGLLYLTSALQIPVVCCLVTSHVFGTCKLLLPKQPGMHHTQVATSLKMLRGWSADNEISITLKKKKKESCKPFTTKFLMDFLGGGRYLPREKKKKSLEEI